MDWVCFWTFISFLSFMTGWIVLVQYVVRPTKPPAFEDAKRAMPELPGWAVWILWRLFSPTGFYAATVSIACAGFTCVAAICSKSELWDFARMLLDRLLPPPANGTPQN